MIAILNNNGHCTKFFYMFNCRSNIMFEVKRLRNLNTNSLQTAMLRRTINQLLGDRLKLS